MSRRYHGFTLLELIVVMLIVAVTIGVTAANLSGASGQARLKAQADQVVALLRKTRHAAVTDGRVYQVTVAAGDQVGGSPAILVAPGATRLDLESDTSLTLGTAVPRRPGWTEGLLFYPDGTSSGGILELAADGLLRTVTISWLTGEASVAAL